MAADASDYKLTAELVVQAHHAGYLSRIHWGLAHCARGVGVCHPIGQYSMRFLIRQDVDCPQIGQGVD